MAPRRGFLSFVGAGLAALAGCAGRSAPGSGTTTRSTTPDPAVESIDVRRSVRAQTTSHVGVRGGLYVVATFPDAGAADRARTRGDARLVLDGERYDPIDRIVRPLDDAPGIAFRVPAAGIDATAGRLVVGDAASALEDSTLARLGAPPSFSLESFVLPGETESRESATATLAVANEGGSAGRFLAELGAKRLSDRPEIAVRVAAGDRATRELAVDLHAPPGDDTTSVVLAWPGGDRARTVALPEG